MKIHALIENTACSESFKCEHGMSLYIESEDGDILFDTGAGENFAENARLLGLDLKNVKLAFLSHGHSDHGGGLEKFLEINPTAPVYISPLAFGQYYNAKGEYIGLDMSLKGNPRFKILNESLKIGNVQLFPCFKELKYPLDSAGLSKEVEGKLQPDDFLHEQYMMIEENGKKVLFSGCSHRGILNIMENFKPDVLIGGFHFMREELKDGKNQCLDNAAEILRDYHCEYYTCHCTGLSQYAYLKERMGDSLHYLSSGKTIIV